MKQSVKALACIFCLVLVSCNSITFVQYEQDGEHETVNKWHHATLNGMVEISRPLDVRSVCGDKAWTKITTEYTFYNLLASALVPKLGVAALYSAWTNKVECFVVPVEQVSP